MLCKQMSVIPKSTSLGNSNFSEFICQWAKTIIFWCYQGALYAIRMSVKRQSSVRLLCLHAPRNRENRPRRVSMLQVLVWSLMELFILIKLIPFPKAHTFVNVSSITVIKTIVYKRHSSAKVCLIFIRQSWNR